MPTPKDTPKATVEITLGLSFEEAQKRLPELLEALAVLAGIDPAELAKTARIEKAPAADKPPELKK